jgi:predicted nucleic-acid-binding Zn-ribbon protein
LSSMCPVCNGLQALHSSCPKCGTSAADDGRLNDYLGPYSPYRPIDDVGLTNGFLDVHRQQCTHVAHCPSCGYVFHRFVQEWPV